MRKLRPLSHIIVRPVLPSNGSSPLGRQPAVIEGELQRIANQGIEGSPARNARLKQNLCAIQQFRNAPLYQGRYTLLEHRTVELEVAEVSLKVRPSLSLRGHDGETHWVLLDFSERCLDERKARIVLQLFSDTARLVGIALKPRFAEYHHIRTGEVLHGVSHRSRLQVQIKAACQTFSDIWNSLEPVP